MEMKYYKDGRQICNQSVNLYPMYMLICAVLVEISRVTSRRKFSGFINLFLTISLFSHMKNYVTFHINEHHFSLFKGYLRDLWLKLDWSFSRSQTSQKKVTTYDRILSEKSHLGLLLKKSKRCCFEIFKWYLHTWLAQIPQVAGFTSC